MEMGEGLCIWPIVRIHSANVNTSTFTQSNIYSDEDGTGSETLAAILNKIIKPPGLLCKKWKNWDELFVETSVGLKGWAIYC